MSLRDEFWWHGNAMCRGEDIAVFFAEDGERATSLERKYQEAKELCAGCPVAQHCLDYAIANNIKYGVWGGSDPDERGSLRRRRQRRANAA